MESRLGSETATGEAWRGTGRHDSHLPPEYERNLRASEITLAEAMKAGGYKTFFAGKWHPGSKGSWPTDHGFEINKGGWDASSPRGGFFSPCRTRIWNPVRRRISLCASDRKPPTLSRKTRAFPSRIPFLLHGSRPDPDHASALEKIPEKAEKQGWPRSVSFSTDGSTSAKSKLPDLRRNDRVDGPCHRDGPRQA